MVIVPAAIGNRQKNHLHSDTVMLPASGTAKARPLVFPEIPPVGVMAEPLRMPSFSSPRSTVEPVRHDAFGGSLQQKGRSTPPGDDTAGNSDIETGPGLHLSAHRSVIYNWYDNELGSSTNMPGDLTVQLSTAVH